MSNLEKKLLPGEQILFIGKKHWIIFFTPALLSIAVAFFLFNSNPYVANVAFLPFIAALISWLNEILVYVTSEFAVTTKRIMMKEGFFYKHTNETRLATIANVAVDQSLLGQILNYGTVIIHPFGGDADPFTQIANPNEFQRCLQAQLDKITK